MKLPICTVRHMRRRAKMRNGYVEPRTGYAKHKAKLFGDKNVRPCAYCGKGLTRKTATYDHVRPLSSGGYNKTKNGVLACLDCNREKGSMTLGEFIALRKRGGN